MKNKDKYNLEHLDIKPRYQINGCGKKITSAFTFDIYCQGELVAKGIKAKEHILPSLLKWLEEESRL